MLGSLNTSTVRRVNALVNAAVVLLVLVGVFVGINWDQMPGGLGDFLAMRITVKNLLVSVICLTGGAAALLALCLSKPAPHAPLRGELGEGAKARPGAA